ncbi:acyltransferase family protein [Marinoscillum sp.]|uniref:acyltransferase family protein n=1 Tax=Marinoscillum sp. TaxID=2024838 RepID=UPI003BAC2E5A
MKKSIYFPGLNGLRFFAALFVFFHHVEQHKFLMGLANWWGVPIIDNLGHQARIIFFVLSGFLITYLFLKEKEKTGKINWWKFQTRRALRLWPVYYLMVLVSFFVLPHLIDIPAFNDVLADNFWKEFAVYMVLFPNLARLLPPIMGAYQFWSVGVQEQFYWIWPLVVRFFSKKLIPFLVVFVGIKVIGELVLMNAIDAQMLGSELHLRLSQALKMWQLLLFEQMAVGALGAYVVFHGKQKVLHLIYHPVTIGLASVIFLILLFQEYHFVGYTVLQGNLALILILNISLNDRFPIQLESPFFNYLGNLSFGMYAYHTAAIAIVISLLTTQTNLVASAPVLFNLALYGGSFVVTMGISMLSFKYLEGYFLSLKKKFRMVRNTDKGSIKSNESSKILQPQTV